jgi:chromosome segregation ATPase
MDSQTEKEIQDEINELESKKNNYGWTKKDADRYKQLKKRLESAT